MARSKGSANFSGSLEVLAGAPLDARLVVETKADLTAATSYPYKYIGMIVSVKSEQKAYMLIASDPTSEASWKAIGSDSIDVTVYKPAGSILFINKPELSSNILGNVYNIEDDFTTTSDFVEGAGKSYSAGTNIVAVDIGTELTPNIKWDVLSAFIDLTSYQEKMQYGVLPEASANLVDKIYQYIGATNVYYTNGYFYKCIENPSSAGTYIWVQASTQPDKDTVIQLDTMPIPTSNDEGRIIEYVGTSTIDYINGYFYECVEDSLNPGTYVWNQKNIQPSSDSGSIQVTTMPTASVTEVDNVYQYIGATDANYTNGYFYKCVNNSGTYSWVQLNVQPSSGGGGGTGTIIDATLTAAGWNNTTKQQTVTFTGYDTAMGGVIGMPASATSAQKEMYASAKINVVSVSGTSFTFECETIPSADLPVTLYAGGGGGSASLPAGGTTGQVLAKRSNTDNDVEWIDAANPTQVNYSTTEHIVGTWIDGKPLYQKTFISTAPTCSTNGTEATSFISIGATISKIVNIFGTTQFSEGAVASLDFVGAKTTDSNIPRIRVVAYDNSASTSSNRNKVAIGNNWTSFNGNAVLVTLQYTKTTD